MPSTACCYIVVKNQWWLVIPFLLITTLGVESDVSDWQLYFLCACSVLISIFVVSLSFKCLIKNQGTTEYEH